MFDSLIQNIGNWIIGTLIGSLGERSAGIMLLALCLLPVSCWAFWKYESSEWKKRISLDLELAKQFDRAGSDAAEKAVVDALINRATESANLYIKSRQAIGDGVFLAFEWLRMTISLFVPALTITFMGILGGGFSLTRGYWIIAGFMLVGLMLDLLRFILSWRLVRAILDRINSLPMRLKSSFRRLKS